MALPHNPSSGAFLFACLLLGIVVLAKLDTSPPPAASSLSEEEQALRAKIKQASATWSREPSFQNPYMPTLHVSSDAESSAMKTRAQFDPHDDYWGLPREDGYIVVGSLCGACHSVKIVMDQRITPEQWQYLLDWMVSDQNMPPLDKEQEQLVHGYLSRHFGPDG